MYKIKKEELLLQIIYAQLILIVLLYFAQMQMQSDIQQQRAQSQKLALKTQKENPGFPMRLKIPSINVDAIIEYVGVTSQGAMAVPNNPFDVGWFYFGPRPGETGSAVIAGHFDDENGDAGVFNKLDTLKKGDKISIQYSGGVGVSFIVQSSRKYDPGYAEDVFGRSDSPHLNLITCDGVWDEKKKSYTKRLVVFADIAR